MTIQRSVVKWFDAKKGYGFIVHPRGGSDVFVHYSQIDTEKRFKTLRTGQVVEYELHDGPKGLHAVNVNLVDEQTSDEEAAASQDEPVQKQPSGVPSYAQNGMQEQSAYRSY
jgi:CspA family cold shock protein